MMQFNQEKGEIIKWLKELVEINSVYPNEERICNYIKTRFTQLGFVVETDYVAENRFNIVISKPSAKKNSDIAFYAHLDTVKNVDGWTKNPFLLTLEDDKAYGLGAYDMKGGMVANILTFLAPELADINSKLIFCVDEENISTGAHHLVRSELLKDVKCIISPEPAFKYDQNGITIGRVGHPMYVLKLMRPSTHFMFYEISKDLNLLASKFIAGLEKFFIERDSHRQFVYVNNYQTKNHGMSVPELVEIELEVSLLPPLSSEELKSQLTDLLAQLAKKFADEIRFELDYKPRATPFLNPYEVSPDNFYLKHLENSVLKITQSEPIPYFRSSVGDDNVFADSGFTVLGIGPSGAGAHAPDEWVSVTSIAKLIAIFIEFVKSCLIANSESSKI